MYFLSFIWGCMCLPLPLRSIPYYPKTAFPSIPLLQKPMFFLEHVPYFLSHPFLNKLILLYYSSFPGKERKWTWKAWVRFRSDLWYIFCKEQVLSSAWDPWLPKKLSDKDNLSPCRTSGIWEQLDDHLEELARHQMCITQALISLRFRFLQALPATEVDWERNSKCCHLFLPCFT